MLASLQASGENGEAALEMLKDKTGLWLLGAPEKGIDGRAWNFNKPLFGSAEGEELVRMANAHPDIPIVLDAIYSGVDEEYSDGLLLAGKKR